MSESTHYMKARKRELEAFALMTGWLTVLLPVVGAIHNAMGYPLWTAGANQAAVVAAIFTLVFGVSAVRVHFKIVGV